MELDANPRLDRAVQKLATSYNPIVTEDPIVTDDTQPEMVIEFEPDTVQPEPAPDPDISTATSMLDDMSVQDNEAASFVKGDGSFVEDRRNLDDMLEGLYMETQKTKSTILHILQLTMEETLQDPRYFYDDENEDYQDDIFDLFIYLASTDEAGRSNQAGRKK